MKKTNNAKVIVFDAGTIINFAMNGLLDFLSRLKKEFNGRFLITEEVKKEIIDKPKRIRRFELEALMIEKLFNDKVLELPYELINKKELHDKTKHLMEILNHSFFARNEFMKIVHSGETSCLALSLLLNDKRIENVVSFDERTARMLCEKPENLRQLFENKLHTKVQVKRNVAFLKDIKVIRSSELMYIIYKKGLIKLKNHVLEALLYAVKYKGCSISHDEINRMKRL